MSTTPDARVVRTREALRQAMIDLAAKSEFDAITVRAIAARAGVGYATFFRHYTDKDALLADVADALTAAFLQQVQPLMLQEDRRGAARSLCAFVLEQLPICRALIAGRAGATVRAGMLRQTMETIGRTRPIDDPLLQMLVFHLTSSTLNLLAWWLRNLDKFDAETMAEIIDRTILTPVGTLRLKPPGGP